MLIRVQKKKQKEEAYLKGGHDYGSSTETQHKSRTD